MALAYEDFKFVEKPAEDLNCAICLSLLQQAMEFTPCSHVLCKGCVDDLLETARNNYTHFLCPLCKTRFNHSEVRPNKYVDRLIGNTVKVYCNQYDDGCQWTGVVSNYVDHERRCDFKKIICPFDGCKMSIVRKWLQQHQQDCEYRSVRCDFCSEEIVCHQLQLHYIMCTYYPTKCFNENCTEVLPRNKVKEHAVNECSFQLILCPFENMGCTQKVLRKDVKQHNEEFVQIHMMSMCQKVLHVQRKLDEKTEKLNIAENQIASLEERLTINEMHTLELQKQFNESLKVNDDAVPLEEFFISGFRRYLENDLKVAFKESYIEWYQRVYRAMDAHVLYKHSAGYMFFKVSVPMDDKVCQKVWWCSNSKEQQDYDRVRNDVIFKNEHMVLYKRYVCTETLDEWNHGRTTKAYLVHPNDERKTMELNKDGRSPDYNCWSKNVPNDFYHGNQLIFCCLKV